jgi:hypothetical protein
MQDVAREYAIAYGADGYGLVTDPVGLIVLPLAPDIYWTLDIHGDRPMIEIQGRVPGPLRATVTCGDGYFPCCLCTEPTPDGVSVPRAVCRAEGRDDGDCIAGGEGSTSCTIGKADCEWEH